MTVSTTPDLSEVLSNKITDELVAMLGFSRTGWVRRAVRPVFEPAATKFARIMARVDVETARGGLSAGAACMLSDFNISVNVTGTENIPADGPLLVVSNHPGAYDSMVIAACIHRKDLSVAVSDVPFFNSLPAMSQRFVMVSMDSSERMAALRACIRHLQSGGALMIFPHGDVEPDPAFMPGAYEEIQNWSPSIEAMLRKCPEARLQIGIASGVLLPRFVNSPITRLRREPPARQKLAEFLQIAQQMIRPQSVTARVNVSFAVPATVPELNQMILQQESLRQLGRAASARESLMPAIIKKARWHLKDHLESIN